MTLVVEDGTGKADAESLASVAAFDARCAALGDTTNSALPTATKEQRLRKATIFMRGEYGQRWQGCRTSITQALDFPRYDMTVDRYCVPSDIVPTEVVNACIDLARDPNIDDLNPNLERGIKREKTGPLETEYDDYSPQRRRYPAIDAMLRPYLTGSGVNASLVRA